MHDHDRALLVDFGGVLTTSVWQGFDKFCRNEGLKQGTVRELFKNDPEAVTDLRGMETGEISPAEFERRFGARLGIPETEGLITRMFAAVEPEKHVAGAVRAAHRAGVRTGLISNSWGRTIYDPALIEELFDVVIISGEVGLHKPQAEIYELAAHRLDVPIETCVFVDDLRENVEGAERAGMTGVLHRDAARTVERLEELFGIPLSEGEAAR